ncbi:hypothetical protein IW261DRAFT_1498170, partial [Armillaria novae-zelandiae]
MHRQILSKLRPPNESLKNFSLQNTLPLHPRYLPNHYNRFLINPLLIHPIRHPQIHLGALKHLQNPPLALRILPLMVPIEYPSLLRHACHQRGDIRADPPDLLRRDGRVERSSWVWKDTPTVTMMRVELDGLCPGGVVLGDVDTARVTGR